MFSKVDGFATNSIKSQQDISEAQVSEFRYCFPHFGLLPS